MRRKKRYKSLTEALLQEINACDASLRQLERDTGLKRQAIAKFARGEQSLRLDLADLLMDYFDLEVCRKTGRT